LRRANVGGGAYVEDRGSSTVAIVIDVRRRALPAAMAIALLVAACSGDDAAAPETTVLPTTTTIEPPPVGDGNLLIGVLLPTSETLIGEPTVSGAEVAIERINDAGGVLGRPVRTVVADEGSSSSSAAAAIQQLLARGVDAIVGPASSLIALATLDEIVSSGTLACSPTASALALDDYPDNDLFFRTIPSDSLQAKAIADVAAQTGAQRVSIVYADDAYGRGFVSAVEDALDGRPISVVDTMAFSVRDEDLSGIATQITGSEAQAVIVLADSNDGTRFIEALGQTEIGGLDTVLVNDAMRNPSSAQRIEALDASLREIIIGVAPQAESSLEDEPFDPPGVFAANGFDCVNLIALSAVRAESDTPRDIAVQMTMVSTAGSPCTTFAGCVEGLSAGLQIDYNGPSGVTELLARNGDPGRAVFDLFGFDETGRDRLIGPLTVSY
jgi:branched-chain amino acid transport system substrate-binding protein